MMITALDKPDILDTIRAEGVELRQRGRNHWGLCPFHSERTPSFRVDTKRQGYYCFGCGAHGDSISFIEKHRGLPFKDALRYLGISTGRPSAEAMQKIKQQHKRAELVKRFRAWCRDYHGDLADLYQCLQAAKELVKTEDDAELLAELYHLEPSWLLDMEILESRDDEAKYALHCEVNGK